MAEQTRTRQISTGKCWLCSESFSKATMTRHLESCVQKAEVGRRASSKAKPIKSFHLVVEGRPFWWLHLQTRADAALTDLDAFLRDTWLECCGHMSAFQIAGRTYTGTGEEFLDAEDLDIGDEGMDVPLRKVLRPGLKFRHEYDFGDTTELDLKVVAEHETLDKREPIRLLARNDPPEISCSECSRPAVEICTQCMWEGKGPLCKKCARQHECDDEMFLPLVNSPRTGVCGYTG